MSINFENLERMSPEALEDRIISEAYLKAESQRERDRIHMEDFTEDLPPGTVKHDQHTVRSVEGMIAADADSQNPEAKLERKMGIVLEEIFSDQVQNDWLGSQTECYKASKYDDLLNGVDDVLEITDADSGKHMFLAVDITKSTRTGLLNKFTRIREEIDAGVLGEVKYYKNADGQTGLKGVVHVVIGLDRDHSVELARLWAEGGKKKELAAHPAQITLLNEILLQLRAERDYAKNTEKPVKPFEDLIAVIEKILESPEKKNLRKKAGYLETEDTVFASIKNIAKDFSNMQPAKGKSYVSLADKMKLDNRWLEREAGGSRPFTLE